jgi:hypothetical protein
MSAWLCSQTHINELAAYYVDKCQRYVNVRKSFKEVAELLFNENVRSLSARYSDYEEMVWYKFAAPIAYKRTIHNPFIMAKQVSCYCYQSCETDDFYETEAYKICEAIKDTLLSSHPDYENAPWGIDDPVTDRTVLQ